MRVILAASGQPLLVIDSPGAARIVGAMVERTNATQIYRGHLPYPEAQDFAKACRQMWALAQMVPRSEPHHASEGTSHAVWLTTEEAAQFIGISDRAVRKRISAGTLPARQHAGRWFIDPKELVRGAA